MTAEIVVDTSSLDSVAAALRMAAEDLQAGRFDPVSSPPGNGEIHRALSDFAEKACDQYRDTVGLIAWLAYRFTTAAETYRQKDADIARAIAGATRG